MNIQFTIRVATEADLSYVPTILHTIEEAAKHRGTGIAKRTPEYLESKINEGKAIIALESEKFAGFCYVETWQDKRFIANSGLIVVDDYRGQGLAKAIKQKAFELSRTKYPEAKIFGLTTGLAVMKINSELGYVPVTFSELTSDETFWKGCQSCVNYDILMRTSRKHCLCTGMLYDPAKQKATQPVQAAVQVDKAVAVEEKEPWGKSFKVYGRWIRFKQYILDKSSKVTKKTKEQKAA